MEDDDLYRVCAHCGMYFGYHRASDDSCPIGDPDSPRYDGKRDWADTKFKEVDEKEVEG